MNAFPNTPIRESSAGPQRTQRQMSASMESRPYPEGSNIPRRPGSNESLSLEGASAPAAPTRTPAASHPAMTTPFTIAPSSDHHFNFSSFSNVNMAATIDGYANQFQLSAPNRTMVHQVAQLPATEQMYVLLSAVLAVKEKVESLDTKQNEVCEKMDEMNESVNTNWRLSVKQKDLFRLLTRHYHLKAINSYNTQVIPSILRYIQQNPARFDLVNYETSDIKKAAVEEYVRQYAGTVRSNLRSAIWDSITDKLTLEGVAHKLAASYWYPKPPKTIPEGQLAQIALMRIIALPLTQMKFAKGADTGFWTLLEKKLDELMKAHGKDRGNTQWDECHKSIITEERALLSFGVDVSAEGGSSGPTDIAEEILVDV